MEQQIHSLTAEPGVHLVDLGTQQESLFELDSAVSRVDDSMVPFDSSEELAEFLKDCDTYVINDRSRRAIGFLSVRATSPTAMEVLSLGILPEAQGQGHGKTLMNLAETIAEETGKTTIELVTKSTNTQAIGFYERLGYSQKEVITGHYSQYNDNDDRVLMEKQLRP